MLNIYPIYKRGELNKIFDSLSSKEKKEIGEYLEYRQARGVNSKNKIGDIQRHIVQIRDTLNKSFNTFNLKDLRSFLALLNSSERLDHTKNDIKSNLKNFLKWKFKDWSDRFSDLEDIRLTTNVRNEEKINSKNLLKKEDIEKLMKTETKMFFKAFFMTQYEGALRTKEVRLLKKSDIKFKVDGDISEVNIYATKTKKARTIFLKDATYYLEKLLEEQKNNDDKGIYIFHSIRDPNKPIDKATISHWMRRLSKKALGREIWCYLLRHSRGTELYRLAKQGKIAKDTAIQFMGHSEDMSSFYTHLDQTEVKKMLKEQIYKLEDMPEEKKHELELEIKKFKEEVETLKENSISKKDVILLVQKTLQKTMNEINPMVTVK